ncbi:MAG: amidohydrolase family protein [Terriglobia bacterium]
MLLLLALLVVCLPVVRAQHEPSRATVIVGAKIVDGRGGPARVGNVRIVGERIAAVGAVAPAPDDAVIEAGGKVVAPGFIDIHNHSQRGLSRRPLAPSQVAQGITTVVMGPDGGSAFPIGAFLDRLEKSPPAVNVLTFVGHATLRRRVLGEDWRRAARPDEVKQMAAQVAAAMREGAWGLSTGLEYDVGFYSTTEEIIALARVAARAGGVYMSHLRDECQLIFEALREAIRIGREAGLPVQISHIKMASVAVWGRAVEAIRLIEGAREAGVDVTADCYPYQAWSSTITVLVPNGRRTDPESVAAGIADVGGAANVLITRSEKHPEYEFKTLAEIARERGITPVDLYIEIVREGGAGVVGRSMVEEDIRAFYTQPWVMVASDGGVASRHPRGAGTYPKVLGRYVRERGWLTLEEAIRKMTSLPATRLGLADRGVIREGMKADLVVFDPERILDRSTYQEPGRLPAGVEKVFVNGVLVWDNGAATGARPGRVLRHSVP